MENFKSGAEIDIRPQSEKDKDYTMKEVVASVAAVNWKEKSKSDWRRFEDQDQNGASSCVENTIKKLAGIMLWLKEKTYLSFSTVYYQLRSNKPGLGMMGVEAFDIWKDNGIPLEQLSPSEKTTDEQLDAMVVDQYKKDIASVFKIGGHLGIDNGDFETVASVIQQTGKGVMVWFYFTREEWAQEIPKVIDSSLQYTSSNALRHSVTAVDFFLYGGKKYILIEDSAHFAGLTYHLISEEFFKARNWFSRYPVNFKFQDSTQEENTEDPNKPKYTFKNQLKFSTAHIVSEDVKALQKILLYEGFFPTGQSCTGYYGAITAKAVLKFQQKYEVGPAEELTTLGGKVVGPKTIAKLNELYGE